MEVGHEAVHQGAEPRQLNFGTSTPVPGALPHVPKSPMKAPPQRVVIDQPTGVPHMHDQQAVNREVHRMHDQGEIDAQQFKDISVVFENHCGWINGLRALILDLQQKVTAITIQAVDNDKAFKRTSEMHDAELKDNLKAFEMIVTQHGSDIREIRECTTSGMQAVDEKHGQAIAALEGVVQSLREEVSTR